ncbi:MAG TPA: chemotaxis protein, partial [Xanthomonadaceae bacterium]|nr:chemotaxis protein [Xanthomonadaceae bacterium]
MSHPTSQAPALHDLPDVPVGLLRLAPDGRIRGCNRMALDLLGCAPEELLDAPSALLWGLDPEDLAGDEGVWIASGEDPARRVRYQRAGDECGGWWLSLPHAETVALLRDAALLGRAEQPLAAALELRPLARV